VRALGVAVLALVAAPAVADDTLKLAVGQRGNWETSVSELGQQAGFFKKRGLVLELLYTQGGGESQQAVISASVDIGVGVGTAGVMAAFAKGAPVRAIGSATTGASDLFWYVRADSPIRTLKDAGGRSVAFSTNGSSTNVIALGFEKHFGIQAKLVATGGVAATFTQVMSGQIDVGWSSPPFALEAQDQGKIRLVARGSDLPSVREQTVRLLIANAGVLARRQAIIARYLQAYRETLDWMYASPEAPAAYAAFAGTTPAMATRVRDDFYPKENLAPDRVTGLEAVMADAIAFKYLTQPLGREQLATLFQVPAPLP
jgi:NitT/TauT family transport system substrate-binding protein